MRSDHRRKSRAVQTALPAILLAVLVVAWQHTFHAAFVIRSDAPFETHLAHVLRDIGLLLPLALLAVQIGTKVARAIPTATEGQARALRIAVITQILMLSGAATLPAHARIDELLGASHVDEGGLLEHAVRDGLVGQVAALPALALAYWILRRHPSVTTGGVLATSAVITGGLLVAMQLDVAGPAVAALAVALVAVAIVATTPARAAVRVVAVAALVATTVVLPVAPEPDSAGAQVQANGCEAGAPTRSYDVAAINVNMVLNRYGDHDPLGMMYVLESDIPAVRAQEASGDVTAGLRDDPIQALAIRANAGECLTINFTNRLSNGMPASFHLTGLAYTATNDGGEVGNNPGTLADPGESISYTFPIPSDRSAEGTHHFHSRYDARVTMAHGLFGALVVEPPGSTYYHPDIPGQQIDSGWEAIIVDPNGIDFREFVIMMHEVGDEDYEVLDGDGDPLPLIDDETGVYRPSSRALNYRSEPFRHRLAQGGDHGLGYSTYTFGEPATPTPRSYLGEPTKTRISHPGSEVFHVYHLHGGGNRWHRNPAAEPTEFATGLRKTVSSEALSTRLDSQSVGPGESYDLEHECGAGGCQQAAGDYLFHCHIGHHYIAGMWAYWRVFDTPQPDLAQMPPDPGYTAPAIAPGGTSLDLIGTTTPDGQTLVPTVDVDQPGETSLEDYLAAQLPPQGVPIDDADATVWDWTIDYVGGDQSQPLFLGEPSSTDVWPGWESPNPGVRPTIRWNLSNARPAWPLLEPHLGKRPPFAPRASQGAPWLGPHGSTSRPDGLCPGTDVIPGRRILHYPLSAIDLPLQISPTLTDTNGMLYVLNDDVAAVRAGSQVAEPLVIRSNVGDCVSLFLTSQQDDANHEGLAKVNIHSHFTQFDPQASDGVVTGSAFEQAVFPYENENRTLVSAPGIGATDITVTNVDRLRVGIAIGIGLGEGMCDPTTGLPVSSPDLTDVPCTEVRTITAINGTTITLDAPLVNQHAAGEAVGVEFVNYLWFSDVNSGTVFFHDHVRFSNWDHGLFGAHIIEPAGSTWHDPTTGAEIRSGARADIHAPAASSIAAGQQGPFREQMLFLHNAHREGEPSKIATFNMRAAPLTERGGDHPFSSVTHGDPDTPVTRAYVGDSVVFRGLGVVQRIGAIRVTGHRFRQEWHNSSGTLHDTVNLGVSEREDMVLEVGAGGPNGYAGDYLYYSTKQEDFEAGAWGILRVHDTAQGDLQPLPGTAPPGGAGFPQQAVTGGPPAPATAPGNPCPPSAPMRTADVELIEFPLTGRQLFVLAADAADVLAGIQEPEPLVLRMNSGDCLEVSVRNNSGDWASFNTSKLLADPQGSAGTAVGFNLDTTIDRGASRTYRVFADQELGTTMFFSLADQRSAMDGAYGAIVVEPAGSTWRNPTDGSPLDAGVTADVLLPDGSGFREQVLLIEDDDDDIGQNVMPYPTMVSGPTFFNYRADPFFVEGPGQGRLEVNPDQSLVYDSDTHGDPANIFHAYVGDPVRVRVGVGSGQQPHVFAMNGHMAPWEVNLAWSEHLEAKGILPAESFDFHLVGGAGGGVPTGADYLFEDRRMPFHEAGLWGIMRTHDTPQPDLLPLAQPGMLRVTTDPAVPSQIVVDGVPMDTWSLTWVELQPGSYEVCFTDVPGFTTPPCETVAVDSLTTTAVTGSFTPRGYLRVDTSPAVPSTISVDGQPRNDWGMWTDIDPGDYEVCWGAVAGFDPPPCETVTVTAGVTTQVTGAFTASGATGPSGYGMLRATTSPALPAQISVDGVPMDTWSLTWAKLAPGSHEVCWSDLEGYSTPSCESVTIVDGVTTVVVGNYSQRGALRVDTAPAVPSTITVDGYPRDDWGVWTDLPAGTYEVCFEPFGSSAPPCETAVVTAGALTTITGLF